MFIRVLLSLFTLSVVAYLGLTFAKKDSPFLFPYAIDNVSLKNSKMALRDSLIKEIDFYQARVKKYPRFQDLTKLAQLYNTRAKTFGSIDNFSKAASYAYRSIGLMPRGNPIAYYVLADIAFIRGEFAAAIGYANTILSRTKSVSAEAFLILAQSHLKLGNMPEANIYADELVRNFPSERAYSLRAVVLSAQGRSSEAQENFLKAISQDEDDPVQASETRVMYARFFLEDFSRINLDLAFDLLSEAVRINPHSYEAHYELGNYFFLNRNYQDSAKYYKLAFQESKQLLHLYRESVAYKNAGFLDLSEKITAQVERLLRAEMLANKSFYKKAEPSSLIRFLLERGYPKDFAEAMSLAREELKFNKTSEAILLYSWSLEMNNNLTEAEKSVRLLLSKNIRSAEVLNRVRAIEAKLSSSTPMITSQRSL